MQAACSRELYSTASQATRLGSTGQLPLDRILDIEPRRAGTEALDSCGLPRTNRGRSWSSRSHPRRCQREAIPAGCRGKLSKISKTAGKNGRILILTSQYVRPRGTVVCIGLPAGAYLRAPVFESVIKMVTIRGSYVGNRKDSAEALEFFRRGVIKAPFKVVGLSELQKVYDLMHKGQIAGRYVLDTSK